MSYSSNIFGQELKTEDKIKLNNFSSIDGPELKSAQNLSDNGSNIDAVRRKFSQSRQFEGPTSNYESRNNNNYSFGQQRGKSKIDFSNPSLINKEPRGNISKYSFINQRDISKQEFDETEEPDIQEQVEDSASLEFQQPARNSFNEEPIVPQKDRYSRPAEKREPIVEGNIHRLSENSEVLNNRKPESIYEQSKPARNIDRYPRQEQRKLFDKCAKACTRVHKGSKVIVNDCVKEEILIKGDRDCTPCCQERSNSSGSCDDFVYYQKHLNIGNKIGHIHFSA